jgi:integrase
VRQATSARTLQEGERLANRLEWQADQVRSGAAEAAPERVPFEFFAADYLTKVAPSKRSRKTIETRVNLHLVPAFTGKAIQDIGAAEVEALLAVKAKTFKPETVEGLRRRLHAMFAVAVRWDLVSSNPVAKVPRIKIPTQEIRFFEAEEIPRLLAAVPDGWRCVFALALYLGARKGEIAGLRVANVDMARRIVTLAHSYDGATKSGKPRRVPVPEELVPLLAAQLPRGEDGYLFSKGLRKQLALSQPAVRVLRAAMVEAGIVDGWQHVCRRKGCGYSDRRGNDVVTKCPKDRGGKPCGFTLWPKPILPYRRFHDLRSTYGTHAYERTGDVRYVQATLGHSTPALTESRYSAMRDRRMLDLADKLSFGVPPPTPTHPALTEAVRVAVGQAQRLPPNHAKALQKTAGDPDGIRTHVPALRGPCPDR